MTATKFECPKKHSANGGHLCSHCQKSTQDTQSSHCPKGKRVRGRVRASMNRKPSIKGAHSLLDPRQQQQERITQMYVYTQKLERALAELQKKVSHHPHPLLGFPSPVCSTTSLRSLSDRSDISSPVSGFADDDDVLLANAFGALSMHHYNKIDEFHGPTATSEYFLRIYHGTTHPSQVAKYDEQESELNVSTGCSRTPLNAYPDIFLLNVQFPCPPEGQQPPDMNRFIDLMPQYERAQTLLNNYSSYFSWIAMPIPKDDLELLFLTFYPHRRKMINTLKPSDAHRLAILFMVFLFGTLYDLDMDYQSSSSGAEDYLLLARAALASDPMTEHTTVHGVQAFILMMWYFRLCPGKRRSHLSYQWVLSGYLSKLVQAIGLYRNCRDKSLYIQDPVWHKCCEQTFWEYNSMDVWQSHMFGRPTSMTSSMIQCIPPSEVDVLPGLDSEFYPWKYSFTRLVSDMIVVISSETVAYADILKCEKNILRHYVPSSLQWSRKETTSEVTGRSCQRCFKGVWQHVSIMYLHRPYFWSAISSHPDDPSQSRYWHSVVMAHNSASTMASDLRSLWLIHPRLIERMAPFWSHAQSAALVLGALVSRSPGCEFAADALRRLEDTCEMFSKAKDSFQPPNAAAVLQRLKEKALAAFTSFHTTPSLDATITHPAPPLSLDGSRSQTQRMDNAATQIIAAGSTFHDDDTGTSSDADLSMNEFELDEAYDNSMSREYPETGWLHYLL